MEVLTLTPELGEVITRQVDEGNYPSAGEVIRDALRLLRDQLDSRTRQLEVALRREVAVGIEDLDQGAYEELEPAGLGSLVEEHQDRRPEAVVRPQWLRSGCPGRPRPTGTISSSYIAQGNMVTADRFVELLVSKFTMLADYPDVGRQRRQTGARDYSFPVKNYLILYRSRASRTKNRAGRFGVSRSQKPVPLTCGDGRKGQPLPAPPPLWRRPAAAPGPESRLARGPARRGRVRRTR